MIRVTFDLDESDHRKLKVKAAQENVTLADLFRAAIADYLSGKWFPDFEKVKGAKPDKKK